MPEQLNVSQSAWTLLDMLQQQLGVSFEVIDSSMRPLAAAGTGEAGRLLDRPELAAEVSRVMKTGDVRLDRSGGAPVGIFPLRVSRRIAGCLLVFPGAAPKAQGPPDASIEGAGHLARTALESDLALSNQLTDARYRTRRAQGILRFLLQLGLDDPGEPDVMKAIIHAATVWFDVECRIYERQPDGGYALSAMLPGADARTAANRIDALRAEKLLAARRFPSAADLEELGFHGRRDELLVLGVGGESRWLMLLAGSIDQEIELTFGVIARVLDGVLQARETSKVDSWQRRLTAITDDAGRTPERVLLKLLEALATEVNATRARVTLIAAGAERVLAAVGNGPPTPNAVQPSQANDVSQQVDVAPDLTVRITLSLAEPARRRAGAELSSWTRALVPWLREVVVALDRVSPFESSAEKSPFESRIQEEVERAKRFNLGLGLVLIGAGRGTAADVALDRLLEAVRPELRASDLLGRVRTGLGAILLVHSEPVGADIVHTRLRQRLEALAAGQVPVSVVQLGKATFSSSSASADSLISQALRQAQSVVLRN